MQRGTFKVSKQGETYKPYTFKKNYELLFKKIGNEIERGIPKFMACHIPRDRLIFYFWFAEKLFVTCFGVLGKRKIQ